MRLKVLSLAVIAVLAAPGFSSAAGARARIPLRTVSVTGMGSVQVRPNLARISLSYTRIVPAGQSIAQAQQENETRVAAARQHIAAEIGPRAAVTVMPNVQPIYTYDREKNQNVLTGRSVMTSVEITLRGEASVERNLGKLFDSEALGLPDAVNVSQLGLNERRQAAAKRQAYAKAIADARNEAAAQLMPGERLGVAIERGNGARSASRGDMRMMAMESGGGAGNSVQVQVGQVEVAAQTSVLFAVTGRARRN